MAQLAFKANKRFANGRNNKKQLVVYEPGKKTYKAGERDVQAWAKRGWVSIVEKEEEPVEDKWTPN